MVSFTRKGYLELYCGPRYVSRHTLPEEAYQAALTDLELHADDPDFVAVYTVKYPDREIDLGSISKKWLRTPGPPVNMTAQASGSAIVYVAWDAPTVRPSIVAGYTLQRSTDNATWTTLQDSTARTYSDTGRSPSTLYYYRVRAYDAAGNQSAYGTAQATTQAAATGFDYYISPTGSDSNPGTQASPWSINAINTKRATYANKRVGLLDGTYNLRTMGFSYTYGSWTYDVNWLEIADGSTVEAVNPRQAIIDADLVGKSPAEWTDRGVIGVTASSGSRSNTTVRNIKIVNAGFQAMRYNAGNNHTVDGVWIDNQQYDNSAGSLGNNSGSIKTADPGVPNFTVRNCLFTRGGAPIDNNRHSYIQTYNSALITVDSCTFIQQQTPRSGACLHTKWVTSSTQIVFKNNYCEYPYGSSPVFINSGTSGTCEIHNNVIYGVAAILSDTTNNVGLRNTVNIYNNTLVGSPGFSAAAIRDLWYGYPPVVNIYNNIISATSWWGGSGTDKGMISLQSVGQVGTMDHNFYGSIQPKFTSGSGGTTLAATLAAWQSLSSKDGNSVTGVSAGFTGTGSYAAQYKLATESVCKTLGAGGTEIGAWAGQSQIGCDF